MTPLCLDRYLQTITTINATISTLNDVAMVTICKHTSLDKKAMLNIFFGSLNAENRVILLELRLGTVCLASTD